MKFRFWGVRGSIPSPGPHTVRHGGNTTCIEVRSDAGLLLVLDAGTGIFPLGQELMRRRAADGRPVDANIFITHSHWDHIHGLPLFTPLFAQDSRVCLHGARDEATGQGIEHVLKSQLRHSYFPVAEDALGATLSYRTLAAGEAYALGDVLVSNVLMNHPVTNFGYRVACGGQSLFFTGDHEPFVNPCPPGAVGREAAQREIERRERAIEAAMAGVDALVVDCSYTVEEYPSRQGWGHGTYDAAIALALRVGARALYCTHHEPTRSDDDLEAVFAEVLARWAGRLDTPAGPLRVALAWEGLEVDLDAPAATAP
ncbi:MBL fold metallo-hydrolase [uncultured Massilia sp.]|uniref:MBL fold metallo-hydrolase n=1 Tax=uncultured Massilia sp. TaxID=169973 RepID=UPI0025EA241B|nr:MBL fold metallo-hydrolase [uncultured Massilia sp.]